jgi:hypothetical protein
MAYTPGFKFDLFISYPTEAKRWAKQFHEDLKEDMWLGIGDLYIIATAVLDPRSTIAIKKPMELPKGLNSAIEK